MTYKIVLSVSVIKNKKKFDKDYYHNKTLGRLNKEDFYTANESNKGSYSIRLEKPIVVDK